MINSDMFVEYNLIITKINNYDLINLIKTKIKQ